jgi:GDPmannose 4,6-dehydratase
MIIMKKALITGITGQDGAYLSKILLDKNYKVYGIVRDSIVSNLANLEYVGTAERIELIPANLLNLSNVVKFLEAAKPDEIYNLAAQSSVATSFECPIKTVEFNVISTLNLLEAIRVLSLKTKFYQACSSEMYGRVKDLPVTEGTVLHPVSPYAISKATGHWLTVNYREAYGLFCCCGILFNHESVLRPKYFVTKKIVSAVVRISKGSKEKITLGNISIKRDWGYAPEYVKAIWLMLQQDSADDYVVASGEAHSLKEFAQLAFECVRLNWQDHVVVDKNLYRPADIEATYGNPEKAKGKLGWKYNLQFEDLIEMLFNEEVKYQSITSYQHISPRKKTSDAMSDAKRSTFASS